MTDKERAIAVFKSKIEWEKEKRYPFISNEEVDAYKLAIKALEQEPRKGHWLRMSDLSEQEGDRYKCSCCGNVVHYTDKMNLYTFNSWCGRCGSDNGRHINYEVEEATEEISNLLKTGYFKTSKEEIKDLEENAVSKQYLEICKRIAERYPEKEVKKKGVSDYLADDPLLTQQVGAEELGLVESEDKEWKKENMKC